MAATAGRNLCIKCGKDKATLRCGGCLQEFCFKHITDHRQELSRQLEEVEVNRDLFRQTLTEDITDQHKHVFMQQIDSWEHDSIKIIQQTAAKARIQYQKHITEKTENIERGLNMLTKQLQRGREEDDYFETDLKQWNEELTRLKEELTKPANIYIRQDATRLIRSINVCLTTGQCKSCIEFENGDAVKCKF